MKPPSRPRISPLRFRNLKRAEPKFRKLWYDYELRCLLRGLKQQNTHSNLNLSELRKKVPKRSLLEIQNQIRSLKTLVVRRVSQQVQKQRREDKRAKAPIEIWAELARTMSGVHEETISSAFSQILVITATEPRSLVHSDPPRSITNPVEGDFHISSRKLIFGSRPARVPPSTSSPVTLPDRNSVTPVQSPGSGVVSRPCAQANTPSPLVLTSSTSSVQQNCSIAQPGSGAGHLSAVPSTPRKTKSHPCEPTSSPRDSTPAPLTPTGSAALSTTAAIRSSHYKRSGRGQRQQAKSEEKKYVVDFEKIYQIVSNINKINNLSLSAMECAVLLDLLMSLPEELPLLDCRELQHHLLQVYKRLTMAAVTPVSFPSMEKPVVTEPVSDRVPEKQSTASHRLAECTDGSLQTHSVQTAVEKDLQTDDDSSSLTEQDKVFAVDSSPSLMMRSPADVGNWEAVGLCPLNPFMVPVTLLKRQESTDGTTRSNLMD
ncbi:snRNA-activating protein complex subunit 2 [Brachyhypopomus gauderio]|uniref:snRNA-activating protein complex subunit 2 n=1 Tax=Brachyhypopomus gauderio TaxID=698409 RepID=UPI004042A8D3